MQALINTAKLLLVLSIVLLSFRAWSQTSTSLPDIEQLRRDVQRQMDPDEFKTVLVGEQETVMVLNEANLPLSKGVIIIVSEAGRNGASQISLAPMAKHFNDFGWATILLTAPNYQWQVQEDQVQTSEAQTTETTQPPPTDQPQEGASSENTDGTQTGSSSDQPAPQTPLESYTAPDTINQKMFEAQELQFTLLMNAAQQEAFNIPGFKVVVAQGTSAAFLAKLYSENRIPIPDAFVAISANWPVKSLNDQVPTFLSQTPVPVMDIYNQWDNKWTTSTARARKVTAEKSLKMHFRQREIIGQALNREQYYYVAREIYGWLIYMGW